MAEGTLHVRGVDPTLWRKLRTEAVRRGVTAGQMLNEILAEWATRQPKQ